MKNIFQDDTLPSGTDLPPMPKNDGKNMPSRPKRQVTPPPMKRAMPQTVYVPVQPVAPQQVPQQMPPQVAYQYIPVNPQYPQQVYPQQSYPQQGAPYYPVYGNTQQPVYPQGVPYTPYPQQPLVQGPAPEQEETKNEYDPGTRVLFQSPDFENKDGSSLPDNVGASFANTVMKNAQESEKASEADSEAEEITEVPVTVELEEVSVNTPSAPKKPPIVKSAPVITTQDLTDEDIYTDSKTGAISFAAYNTVNSSLDVEEFEQELGPYEEYEEEEEEIITDESNDGEKNPLPKSELIRRIVLGVSIVAIIISAGMLLNEWRLSKQNDDVMDEANNLIITESTTNKKDKDKDKTTTKPLTPEEQWAKIKKEYPNVLFPATIQLKYAKLYGENQDFVGYLSADGVNLNLPVVQTDNDETYLNKNFYGSTTKYGCPFVTHLNNISYNHLDMNTVIFGHHMNNGTIFGALDKYKTLAGYKSAPVITFNTLYKDYQWKIIAAFITNGYIKDDNNYIFPYYFTNLSATYKMSAYLSELAQRSLYDTGVDVLPTDKLLTLSTCSHEFEDARFVVVARLVREGERTDVDTSKAVVNSKPRYPQAYYNKKGMTNPYKNANRWIAD